MTEKKVKTAISGIVGEHSNAQIQLTHRKDIGRTETQMQKAKFFVHTKKKRGVICWS